MTRLPMRFQFRLWNLLAAIFWIALWLTVYNLGTRGVLLAWGVEEGFIFGALVSLPFAAIGALRGKFWPWYAAGCLLAAVLVVLTAPIIQ